MLKLTASLPLLLCAVTPQVVAAAGPAATPPTGSPAAGAPGASASTPGSPHAAGAAAAPQQAHGQHPQGPPPPPAVLLPTERHLRNLRQLTFGGENAEAYFSFDGKRLSMQSTTAADRCDQIYTLDVSPLLTGAGAGAPPRPLAPLSAGHGRNTCSFFVPDGSRVLFSATRHAGDACPPVPDTDNGKAAREAGYCRTFNHRAMQTLATGAYDTLVIAARWGSCRFDDDFAARFTAAVHELRRHVRHIVILGPTPTLRDAAPDCVAMQAIDETSPDPGGIPMRWAVKGLIPLGFVLLALQTVGALMRLVLTERQRREAGHA